MDMVVSNIYLPYILFSLFIKLIWENNTAVQFKIIFNGEFHTVTNFPEKCKRKLNLNPNGPMEYFHYEVKSCDLDHNGHMNNARYLNIIFNYLMYVLAPL